MGLVAGDASGCIEIEKVIVEKRQRFEHGDIERLAESIRKRGQLQPIIITKENVLVVGERRLRAKQLLRHHFIDYIYAEDCEPEELKEIEFEENYHRKDLDWQEKCLGIVEIFELRLAKDPKYTVERMASTISVDRSTVSRWLQVGQALVLGDEDIKNASSLSAAYNLFERKNSRELDKELDSLDSALEDVLATPNLVLDEPRRPELEVSHHTPRIRPASKDILCTNFHEWAREYEGPKFNLIHCDFPYGIQHQKSKQGSSQEHGKYEDSPDVYWGLLESLLMNHDRFMSPASHIVFWLSMNHFWQTCQMFFDRKRHGGEFIVDPFPLIWFKSDNTGILPDPQRGPRRVYEAALMIRRGDRKIVRAVSNLYACPSRKKNAAHLSEKPLEMIRYFLQMYVDSSTRMLDPTCGSGTAIIAAESLGALAVRGLDISEEHVERTQMELNRLRTLGEGIEGGDSDEVA